LKKIIETEIEINATPERVWKVLTAFDTFPIWNPFVKEIQGKPIEGEKLRIFIQPSGAKGMKFTPTVLKAEPGRELRWLGRLLIRGLFDGEHYFLIEPIEENKVRFVHGENFSGILVGMFAKRLDADTLRGFKEMNAAVKKRAER
jgi:hypothetical protein